MKWETVKISASSKGRTAPFASVGNGKLAISAAACELIPNYEEYKYAELLKCKENGRLCIGVRFLMNSGENTIALSRKKAEGKYIAGMEISSKKVIEGLFGINGSAKKTTRYDVKRDVDEPNVLVIYT